MRRAALATFAALTLLAGCGSPPTEQEENLEERANGSDRLPTTDNAAANSQVPSAAVDDVGSREGIPGATQGPTAGDSDAPAAGEDSRPRT